MTYEKYLDYSREELLEKVRAVMSPKRFNHVLGVERAAIALAEKYGYDTEKAGLAGLLHDYAKALHAGGHTGHCEGSTSDRIERRYSGTDYSG